jgi:hypothetical protein
LNSYLQRTGKYQKVFGKQGNDQLLEPVTVFGACHRFFVWSLSPYFGACHRILEPVTVFWSLSPYFRPPAVSKFRRGSARPRVTSDGPLRGGDE